MSGNSSDEGISRIIHQIDVAHSIAKQAYHDKNVKAYMETFAPDMKYEQLNGQVIGFNKLEDQVKSQFASVRDMDSSYERESIEVLEDKATETLMQKAWATVIAFGFVKRTWRVTRCGIYTWIKTETGWKINRVQILTERIE